MYVKINGMPSDRCFSRLCMAVGLPMRRITTRVVLACMCACPAEILENTIFDISILTHSNRFLLLRKRIATQMNQQSNV